MSDLKLEFLLKIFMTKKQFKRKVYKKWQIYLMKAFNFLNKGEYLLPCTACSLNKKDLNIYQP